MLKTRKINVLIVDDDEQMVRLTRLVLQSSGCACQTASSGAQALSMFKEDEFDLVITDLNMTFGSGMTLVKSIRRIRSTPVIVVTGFSREYADEIRHLEDVRVLQKPVDTQELLECVREFRYLPPPTLSMPAQGAGEAAAPPKAKPSILIADDDAGLIRLIRTMLEPLGMEIREAHDAVAALLRIHERAPDLAILDVNMPSGNGLSVCEMLATDAEFSRLPVVVLTGDTGPAVQERCRALGARYLQKGQDMMEQIKRVVREILSEENSAPRAPMHIG